MSISSHILSKEESGHRESPPLLIKYIHFTPYFIKVVGSPHAAVLRHRLRRHALFDSPSAVKYKSHTLAEYDFVFYGRPQGIEP